MTYNTAVVLVGAGLIGVTCAAVGSFAVQRRHALLGDVVAHTALAGSALAVLISGIRSLELMLFAALGTGLLGLVMMRWLRARGRVSLDAVQAITLASGFGLGVVLSRVVQSVSPTAARSGLDGFLYGKAASLLLSDVVVMASVAVIILALLAFSWPGLKAVTFDLEGAAARGMPARTLTLGLDAALVLVVIVALPMVGIVLAAALTILPALTARFLTDRFSLLVGLAMVVGAGSAVVGILLSASAANIPTGPAVVLTAGVAFLVAFLFSPKRGLVGRELARAAESRALSVRAYLRSLNPAISPEGARRADRLGLTQRGELTPLGIRFLEQMEDTHGR